MIGSCELVHEALSARLDDEEPPVERELVDAHLAACASCREFAASLTLLNRRLRVHLVEQAPDLVAPILAAHDRVEGRSRRRRLVPSHLDWRSATRWVAAAVPLGVAVPAIALGAFTHPHVVPSHAQSPCTKYVARPWHEVRSIS